MRRRWLLLMEVILLTGLVIWVALAVTNADHKPPDSIDLKVQLKGARDRAYLFRQPDGKYGYRILSSTSDGHRDLSPEEFARLEYESQRGRSLFERVLNVTSPAGIIWVGVGLLGQVLFTGRMIIQWLASEKKKESVVPPIFWWMSLIGASMLMSYFLWRLDPIGILGQAFGWFIYVRNLWLIYRKKPPARITEDPGPEPELGK